MKLILSKVVAAGVFLLALLAGTTPARADVGLVLNSSMGTGSSFVTSGGHASIYLSRICPVTAVKVRLCEPGEQGSILSNYSDFHEDKQYQWNIIPVSDFLYGVDDAANRPLYATPALQTKLREQYLRTHLGTLCATEDCQTNPDANWRDLVGATFLRTVYIFEVKTTVEQDEEMVRRLNASANVNRYSGVKYNCADFARDMINSYFPNAVKGHHFADFYMTTPKSTARSLVHYAEHHPEMDIRVTRFTQLPSEIRRSDPARAGMETIYTTKKFLVPMAFRPEELAAFSVGYLLTDRFSAERSSRKHAPDNQLETLQLSGSQASDASPLQLASFSSSAEGNGASASVIAAPINPTWKDYRTALVRQEKEAREAGVIADDAELARAFRLLGHQGVPELDSAGRPWMKMPVAEHDAVNRAVMGLTVAAVEQSPDEDSARLAYKFQLARVRFYLHSHGMDREGLREFSQDWVLLGAARESLMKTRYDAAIARDKSPQDSQDFPDASQASGMMMAISAVSRSGH